MEFEIIDVVFAALVALLVIRCVLRGFVEELLSMASGILGLAAAFCFYRAGGRFINERYLPDMSVLPQILAFVCIFLIVFGAVKLLAAILKDIITRIQLGGLDRVLGGVFGALEGFILVALILFALTLQPLFDAGPLLEKSFFARRLLPLIGVVGQSLGELSGVR